MFSDERLAEMVLGTIESPSASASHRPLRLVLDSRSIDDEVHSIAADTGVGCSTMYAEVGLLLGIDPGPVNISHGAGFSRQVLPRHGPIKQQVGQLPHTLELQGRLTLHGGMGKRGLSTSATTSAASSSTMVDSRPLPKKRSRKGKTPDTADVQQLLEMFAEEEKNNKYWRRWVCPTMNWGATPRNLEIYWLRTRRRKTKTATIAVLTKRGRNWNVKTAKNRATLSARNRSMS